MVPHPRKLDFPLVRDKRLKKIKLLIYTNQVAALGRSDINDLLPFVRTTEQTTETMPLHKTITAADKQKNYKLTRAAHISTKYSEYINHVVKVIMDFRELSAE